jgi:hypothetical protein
MIYYRHHALHVLVGERRFLGELGVRDAAHHNPLIGELAPHLGTRAAGAVAGAPEAQVQVARQNIQSRSHAAGDEHRLASGAAPLRRLGIPRAKGPRGALPVHAESLPAVFLNLGDVVRDVVQCPRRT